MLRWQLVRLWASMGALELVAVALLGFSIGMYCYVVQPLEAEILVLDNEVAQVNKIAEAQRAGLQSALPTDAKQRFVAFFPVLSAREQQITTIHRLVQQHGLQLGKVDYRPQKLGHLPLSKVSMQFQTQGAYEQQRLFVHELLKTLPNLAVDRMSLEKAGAAADEFVVAFELSLIFRFQ
jgi:hypothetical protein